MKRVLILLLITFTTVFAFSQSEDDLFNDDDLFGSEDDIFSSDALAGDTFGDDTFGDDMFGDNGIVDMPDVSAKSDLSKGIIFDTGSVKIGGSLDSSISTNTVLYSPDEKPLGENIYATKLTPKLSALLSVDARPTEVLRIYTKFGLAYPFVDNASTYLNYTNVSLGTSALARNLTIPFATSATTTIANWFKLKELFTDFSIKDTAFFRFGIHTVTWGAGYFFSPVSDMINTTSIDPENPTAQVDGALNLRTQIVFPGSQNCLWFYVIPSTNFENQTAESYVRETAFAGKVDFLIGGWEFGLGGFYKYQNAPKAMLTATGSLRKISFFGELVYSYGAASEWSDNTEWDGKTNIFQATAGFSYYWKEPLITVAMQYYFNGNDKDSPNKYIIGGHNIAAMISFGKVFGTKDITASIFAMANFGRSDLEDSTRSDLNAAGISDELIDSMTGNSLMINSMIYYSPITVLKIGMGPVVTFKTFEKNPTISLKLTASLGGGKF